MMCAPPKSASTKNHTKVIGPNNRPTLAVPRFWTAESDQDDDGDGGDQRVKSWLNDLQALDRAQHRKWPA